MTNEVTELDDRRLAVTIQTPGKVHVIPISFFEGVVAGRQPVTVFDDWEEILPVIIDEWIKGREIDG